MLLAGYVSVLIAPPGVGKSTLTNQLALALSQGIDWAGWKMRRPGRVWIYNNEDDMHELKRRIRAARMHMGIESTNGMLLVDSGADRPLVVAVEKDGVVQRTKDVEEIIAELKRNEVSALIVDPFAETHGCNENSNDQMKIVTATWRYIAQKANCAILLVHHTRKAPAGDNTGLAGNMDSARGAGAVMGVARVAATLLGMSAKDAEKLGVNEDERHLYIRYDDAKANLSLITNQARWFRRVSVGIGNGDPGLLGDYPDQDIVGVLEPVDFSAQIEAAKVKKAEGDAAMIRRVAALMYERDMDEASLYTVAKTFAEDGKKTRQGYDKALKKILPRADENAFDVSLNGTVYSVYMVEDEALTIKMVERK